MAERANALLKVTFKALRRVSLDPKAITRITRAALVLLQMEHAAPAERRSRTVTRGYRERLNACPAVSTPAIQRLRWRSCPTWADDPQPAQDSWAPAPHAVGRLRRR